ncbi:MAG: hypothetical protein FWF10_09110 [Clostridiales bacterium]|nr:hypothetical protein [Clostridiales bacterium]
MKRLYCLFLCAILLCLCACGEPQVAQENTPAPAADTAAPIAATPSPVGADSIRPPTPAPSAVPEPTTLPIEDPRDFLIRYWVACEPGADWGEEDRVYDEALGDYVSNFVLSPYETITRYAFYPDGQFLHAIPQSERSYPIYEYGAWQLTEDYNFVVLDFLQRYVCGEDDMYTQDTIALRKKHSHLDWQRIRLLCHQFLRIHKPGQNRNKWRSLFPCKLRLGFYERFQLCQYRGNV